MEMFSPTDKLHSVSVTFLKIGKFHIKIQIWASLWEKKKEMFIFWKQSLQDLRLGANPCLRCVCWPPRLRGWLVCLCPLATAPPLGFQRERPFFSFFLSSSSPFFFAKAYENQQQLEIRHPQPFVQ